jgi:hypothetical protein
MRVTSLIDWLHLEIFTNIYHKTVFNTIIHMWRCQIVSSNSLKMADR